MKEHILKQLVSRGVVRVPDIHPKTNKFSTNELLFTVRPGWSNIGRYEKALPGGKLEIIDFSGDLSIEKLQDPEYVPSQAEIENAALKAAERELFEELGLTAVGLFYVDTSTNKSGWTTFSFATDLPQKPTLLVKPDSAGTYWMDEEKIVRGNPRLLSGHLGITRRAIKVMNEKNG